MSVGLRWEATGVTGSLFPALDADIRITDNAGEGSRVALTGSYRPPFGAVGDGLDRLALHTVDEATIRALLDQITALDTAPAEDTQTAAARQEDLRGHVGDPAHDHRPGGHRAGRSLA